MSSLGDANQMDSLKSAADSEAFLSQQAGGRRSLDQIAHLACRLNSRTDCLQQVPPAGRTPRVMRPVTDRITG